MYMCGHGYCRMKTSAVQQRIVSDWLGDGCVVPPPGVPLCAAEMNFAHIESLDTLHFGHQFWTKSHPATAPR